LRNATAAAAAPTPAVAAPRQRILEAAARCFAKSGFARTRIEDVAAEARVSRALVYHHCGSKEELARQVQEHMLEEWSAAVDRAIAGAASAGDALAAWLRVNLADLRRRPLLHAILADAAILASFDPYLDVSAERHLEAATRLLVAGLRQGR
jgi:AcrR family transcriptional regulator